MRVGVYGGSFHPPHVGHAMVASWLLWTRRVDAVWLVPAYHHAFDKPLRAFADRVEAAEALAGLLGPAVRVETIEADLPTPSFTVQTLAALSARHPSARLRLVIGADVLPQTPSWRDWARIEAEHAPIVVGREGHPPVPGAPTFPDISSTDIRARLRRGEPVDHLVPAPVLDVIRRW